MPNRLLSLFTGRKSKGPVRVDVVAGQAISSSRQMVVIRPSRYQGHTAIEQAHEDNRHFQMVNVVYSTTAAMYAAWEAGRAEARMIKPRPGSGVKGYDLRASLREPAKGQDKNARTLELFLCEILE